MTDRDPRRRFTKTERKVAWLSQDGKSAISGEPLSENIFDDFAHGLRAGETKDDIEPSKEMPPWIEEKLLKDTCNELAKLTPDEREHVRAMP